MAGHAWARCAFGISPDGRTLASGSEDTTVVLWDVPSWLAARPKTVAALSDANLAALWDQLAKEDSKAAFAARQRLVEGSRQSVPWLRSRVKSVPAIDGKLLKQ